MKTKNKRKHDELSENTNSRVEVIVEDLSSHPVCQHGPTLLFSSTRGQFYACSSCRGRECPVRITKEEWEKPHVKLSNIKYQKLSAAVDKESCWKKCNELIKKSIKISYCVTCDVLTEDNNNNKLHKDHKTHGPLGTEQLSNPSSWLPPLQNDSQQAQYFFSDHSLDTIFQLFSKNNIKNVLCIGAPTVHEKAKSTAVRSMLLDLDVRYRWFCPPEAYLQYNMFNNHLFCNDDEEALQSFLESSGKNDGNLCIIIDPPFGGRVEPLAHTLSSLCDRYRELTSHGAYIVWVFPYFAEPHITNLVPELKMHDFQVTYTNHAKFKSRKANSRPSPVRLFTNIPLATLNLSGNDNYKHCRECNLWVYVNNRHCNECARCTSKSGAPYKHCVLCKICVKASYEHCGKCGRCSLPAHRCDLVLPPQTCYTCGEKGHKKINCSQKSSSSGKIKKK